MPNILVGIQARTHSESYPDKINARINGQTMLDRVIRSAQKSAHYVNKWKQDVKANVALIVPVGDPLVERYRKRMSVFTGSQTDLVARYMEAVRQTSPDYIVRITADCPLLPPYVITKHMTLAVNNSYDFVTNAHPEYRTAPDGHDVEVFSRRLLEWVDENARTPRDREHVGPLVKENAPSFARIVYLIGFVDQSHLKLSVDTEHDLKAVTSQEAAISEKVGKILANGHEVTRF